MKGLLKVTQVSAKSGFESKLTKLSGTQSYSANSATSLHPFWYPPRPVF